MFALLHTTMLGLSEQSGWLNGESESEKQPLLCVDCSTHYLASQLCGEKKGTPWSDIKLNDVRKE